MAENNNNNEYLRKVYERVGQKYAVGSFDSFVESLKNPEKRKKAYDYLSDKYIMDDLSTFDNKIKGLVGDVKPTQQSSGSYIGDVAERLGAGAANFAGGALTLAQKVADKGLFSGVGLAGKLLGAGNIYGKGMGKAGEYLKNKGEEWKAASDRYKGKTFFDLAKEGRYGEAMGDLFLGATESLPVSLGIMATGGTGLATVGAVTASDKYDELRKQNPNMSEAAALGNSVVTGISEAVSEMLGPGVIGKTIKGLYMAGGKKAAAEAMEKGIMDKLTQFVDKHWLIYPIVEEGLTEAVNAAVEYGVDRLTGIERTDDFLQTITEAAGYGAAGGAQFTPVVGGFKYMNKRRKDKAIRSYNDNLPVGEQLLGENLEQFNAAVTRFQNENRPEQIQNFVNEVARVKGLDNEQTRSLIDYTGSILNYNNYINSVQDQIEEETRKAYDEIDRTANRETNTVMLASMSEGSEPVYVTGGNLVLGNDGQIDYDNSSSTIYYLDENGKVKQGTPQMFATVVSNTPVETLYTEAALSVNERITQQEDNDIRNASFNNGDNVVLPTGETGVVQQYDDDGNLLVNIGGEIRPVAPEGVMNAEEAATVQAEQQAQQEVAEQQQMEMQYPRKGEDIDYSAITDPNMYASALQSEFGEEAGTVLDEMIADKQAELEKASKGKDAITRRRATNKINSELSLLNEARNIITPVQTEEVIEQVNDNVTEPTPVSEDIEAATAEVPTAEETLPEQETQPAEQPLIPTNEQGVPQYHLTSIDNTLDDLLDGSMSIEEVNSFVDENIKAAESELKEAEKRKPVMGISKFEYLAQRDAIQEELNNARQKVEYWNNVKKEITPEEQGSQSLDKWMMEEPMNLQELAAQMLASGRLKLLQSDYKKQTGYGNREARKMFGIFASKANGGVSLEKAGEIIELRAREEGLLSENQEIELNSGFEALMDVLTGSSTKGDINSYVANNRERILREEREYQEGQEAAIAEQVYGMSLDDYRSYVDATERNIRQSQITDEQYNELQGEIYDEMMAREQEFYEEIDEALDAERQRETEQEVEQEEYIENESREFDSINQGSNELLPETQINQEGRSNVPQESEQTAADIVGEDGATQGNEGIDKDFEELKTRALTVPGVTVFEEVTADDGTKGIRVGNKNSATTYWYEDVSPMVNEELDLANKMLSKLKEKHDSNVVLSKVKNSSDFWEWLKSTGEADSKRGVSGYDIAGFVKGAKEELNNEKLYSDALIPMFEYIKTKYGKPVTSSPVQETEMEMIERVAKEQNEKQKKESVQFVVDNFGETIQHEGDEFRIKGYDGATGKVTIEKNQEENVVPVTEVVRSIFRGEKPTSTTGKKESKSKAQPKNKLVTDERYEELKKRMRAKLGGQMNLGIDPEILAIGTEMAVYHIEKGARKFADYAKNMIDDMGDAIRPYLKAFYNGARDLPEVQQLGWDKDMTSYDEVSNFDTANFGKEETNAVESEQMSAKEKEVDKQAETAKAKIKKERNKKAKNESKDLPLSVNDLFTFNNSENEQGNTEPDKGLGTEARENIERTEQRRDDSGVYGDNVSDKNRGGRVSGTDGIKQPVIRNTNNFRFPENVGIEIPSGEIAKLKANIEAIKTLKEVEKSGVPATPEQQSKMAKYIGWGGLAEALNENKYNYRNNRYYADNNWNNKYLSYYEQLKELLTKEEFDSAVKSTTTSHYTPSEIVSTMWKIAERLGFKGGNISEPAMGIGNILGMIPKTISDNSYLSGFEIDSLSGRIAKALYPDADIKVEGYEKSFAPNTKDLVITNVPFGKNAPYDKVLDKQFRKKLGSSYNLHNYFILKGLLELKEGGLGVFVTTSATMDGADSRFREYVSGNNYDLIGAIRLPNNAFLKGAGTSVTTDVIVFRKRKAGESSNGIGFTTTVQIGEGTYQENGEDRIKPIMVNEYFANNPDMMLGEMMTAYDAGSGGLYSGASQTLKANPGADLGKELGNAIEKLPENILSQTVKQKEEEREKTTLKEGTITTSKGKVYVSYQGELKPVDAPDTFEYNGKTRNTADAVNDYNNIKNVLNRLIAEEQTKGANPEPTRKELNKVYDDFVTKYGTLNRNKALDNVFAEDVEHGLPFSLETVKRVPSPTGKSMVWQVSKADGILNKRVSYPFEIPTKAENISDAVNISKSYKGSIDIPYIAEITGKTEEEATREMLETGLAYKDPITGNIIDKNTYLSGNVKDKLLEARAAVEDNPEFQKNVDDLENVQPERIPYGNISFRLGTTWIPEEFINAFAETVVGISYANAMFVPEVEEYIVDKGARITDYAKSGGFKTSRLSAIDIFKAALNQRKPKIYDEVTSYEDGTKKTRKVVNEQETQAAAEKISEMSDKFVEYMDSKTMFHQRIEDVYNDKYNNYVLKKYEKPAFENYPNANKDIKLRDHQTKAVQRCLSESTLLAHQVGTGKTFTMITTAMEMRRLGIANKPMIVVQNATLEDFVRDFYKLYPSAKILSPSKEERNAENRKRLFNLIATGDFDAIVVPQSFMSFIPDSEERKKSYIQKRIDDFEAAIERIDDRNIQERLRKEVKSLRDSLEGVKKTKNAKGKAKTAESITAKTERVLDRRTDDVLTFEQMGVDALFVDEAHNYKKIGFPSKMSNVKGIDTSASQRANSMLLKAQWVAEKNGGRNVILATGTPITNTMAEVWTMMNFVSLDILDAYSIKSFDEFATTFGSVEPSLEFTATGNFKIAERFKSYTNVPELVKAFRSHTDVVLTEDVKEFKQSNNIPKLKDGKMTNVVVEKNEDLEDVMQTLIKELEAFNKLTGKAKKEKSALPLVVFTKAKQAAIDLRLLNPTFPDNPDSKTNKVVENVIELYKESTPDKGTQLIFCDSYQSPSETPKMDLFDVDLSVPQFNLYNDIKRKLIEGGIPASQIAIVSNYEGEKRNALFDKVRNGDVRILIGSTEKMGVGVNVQDRLFALHHIDAPIRPMDFEQRNGRILRQGNLYATWGKPVNVVTYGVKGTLDATAYDRLRIKQNFINQMMKGDTSSRIMEEQDDEDPSGMTFSEMAATLSGDKTAQLLFVAQNKLKKLQNSKRSDLNSKSSMQINISVAKSRLNDFIRRKDEQQKITDIVKSNFPEGIESVTVKGNTINKSISTELAPIVEQYYDDYTLNRNTPPLKISLNNGKGEAIVHFNEGKMVYNLYVDGNKIVENRDFSGAKGLMSSIDRQLEAQEKNLSTLKKNIEDEQNKISGLEEAIKKPWGKEEELKAAQQEVEKLQQQLEEKAKQSDIVRQIESESKLDVNGNIIDETIRYRAGVTTGENTNDPYYRFIGETGAANLDRAEEATTMDNIRYRANISESERKQAVVDELSNSLNTPITVYYSLEEIVDENPRRQRNKRASKGWYDSKTGEVFIVMPNNNNAADIQATILHEVVTHKGLRGLLGENFETMMDNIFKNVPKNVRQALVVEALSSYNGNVRIATEEYLARIAERGIPEPSIWGKIKSAIKEVFRNMGINLVMTDEDIAYLLWKSKNRLNKGDSFKTMLDKAAKDAEMRSTLLYRNSSMRNGTMLNTHPTQRVSMRNTINTLTSKLTPVVKNGYKAFREGYQDRMLPLRDFQEEITNETGHKVADFENAYVYDNTVQSKTQYDSNKYKDNILKPLVAEIAKLSKVNGKVDSDKARLVESYMMIKHGLERNALMRERDLAKIENPSPETIEKYRNKDYSGLTALSKEVLDLDVMDEAALTDWVNDFEKSNNTSKLWSLVKTATEATLDKLYQSNMLSRDKMNELKGMYKYYIPLKEWDETTAGEVFDYVEKGYTDKVTNPIKKAKGRTSRAGSALANMVNDFDNATIIGYKNLMKLRLANLVRNSKTNKASVSNMWYVKTLDNEGNEVWEPAVPEGLTEDAAKNAEIIADFEEKMNVLAENGEAKHSHEVLKLGMPIKNWQERQHMIRVKEGGRDMVVYINGDPKVSQAVNGLNRPSLDNSMLQGLNWVKRNMMLNYTSRNINFIARNFIRDMVYTNTMNFVKYGAKFELEYAKNIIPALKALSKRAMGKKAANAEEQKMFDAIDAFERGGGKTGYVEIVGYDKYKREVDKLLRKSAGGNVQVKDVINTVGSFLEQSNDVIENTARFATYLTAKKVGMTELQAIRAAKDVSVNFNRKGSGAMGGIYFQNFYFFFNAAIQGTHNFLSAVKAQPKRAAAAMAMWGTMGFAYSMLMSLLMGDDDEYNQIPDYVRQNNLLIPISSTEKFALIPLPVELRILFGAGDMFAQASRGEYKGRDFTSDMMAKIMEFSPKSFEGNLSGMSRGLADSPLDLIMKNFTPDAVRPIVDALYFNENFFGKRVSGRNEFNKYVPEFQKVTTGTSKALIKASEKLNEVTGGDYATKGSIDPVLLNPSIAEYLFEQYFGGIGKLISQIYKTSEGAFGDGAELRNIPVVSGLSYDTTNLIPRDYTQKIYDNFVKFYEEAQSRKRMYEKGLFSGEDLSDNFKAFVSDKDYMKYSVIDRYKKIIDSMYDKAKLPMSDDEKKRIFENVRKLKKEMVKQIDKIDNEE